jgi:hypothetical protein
MPSTSCRTSWNGDTVFLSIIIGCKFLASLLIWSATDVLGKGSGLEMSDIAERIVAGFGFSSPYLPVDSGIPTVVSSPLYVWLIAGVYEWLGVKTDASRIFLQFLNLIFHAVTLVLFHYCRAVLGAATARLFAVLFVCHPHVIFLASNVWESSLTLMLLGLILYWVTVGFARFVISECMGFGVLLGLTALSNPAWSLMYPLLCLGIFYWRMRDGQERMQLVKVVPVCASALLGFLLVVTPWLIRNYQVTGEIMYVRGMSGPELFKGNHAGAGGGHGQVFVDYFLYSSPQERLRYSEMGESAYDRAMSAAAMREIQQDPVRYLQLTARRVLMWWTGDFDVTAWYYRVGDRDKFMIGVLYCFVGGLTSLAAFWGVWRLRGQAARFWPLWLYVFFLPVPYYLIIVGFRYQSSLLPFLLIPCAVTLHALVMVARQRGWSLPDRLLLCGSQPTDLNN